MPSFIPWSKNGGYISVWEAQVSLLRSLEKLMLRQGIKIKYQHDVEHLSTRNNEISELHFTNGHSQKSDIVDQQC